MGKFIIPSRGNSGKGSMALNPIEEQPRGSACSKNAAARSLEVTCLRREKRTKIYMRFTVQQKSVEVVDREISWGWPLPARANGKLPGSCVLARGSCSGVLSSSLPTVSFAGALLLTWVLDLLSSPLLCHFFLPFFFLCLRNIMTK